MILWQSSLLWNSKQGMQPWYSTLKIRKMLPNINGLYTWFSNLLFFEPVINSPEDKVHKFKYSQAAQSQEKTKRTTQISW